MYQFIALLISVGLGAVVILEGVIDVCFIMQVRLIVYYL